MVVSDTAGKSTQGYPERIEPGKSDRKCYLEHVGRYEFASQSAQGKDVLDAACGTGYGAPVLVAAGAKSYRGLDISAEAIGIAESRYKVSSKISFMLGDASRLDGIGDGTIDLVASFETIEHLADPRRFLASVRRVLVPGGTLIVSTPNRAVRDPGGNLSSTPANPFHLREWNTTEFKQLLRDFFTVEKVFGQSPHLLPDCYWKYCEASVRRHAKKHEFLQKLVGQYRRAKSLRERYSLPEPPNNVFIPVQPIRPWQRQTIIVCVCRCLPFQTGEEPLLSARRGAESCWSKNTLSDPSSCRV
jgi:ubiquinone/menaquinone biosynthesis C-methylase UbiE